MMSNNSDYVNNLLVQLSYVDLGEDYEPGDNLIDVLRNGGDTDLANALEAAGYGNYVIRDYANQNDTNGFAAIAIEDPATGDVGISYRGTENLDNVGNAISDIISGNQPAAQDAFRNQIDMIDNISTAVTGDSAQAQQALAFFEKNQSTTGKNYLYGHSKGGELALEAYVDNFNNIENVHIINPQPINWASLNADQLNALNNGKIDALVIDGDLVWLLGGVPYPVRIIKNNGSNNGNLFGPHSLSSASYDPATGAAIKENWPYANYPGQGLLGGGFNCLITNIQAGYAFVQTQLEWIQNAYHYFSEEIPETAQKFWDSVNNAWTETKEFVGETVQNVEDFFSDLSEAASNWWESFFGKDEQRDHQGAGSRLSRSTCQFLVDTRQLRNTSTRLAYVARSLESLETTIGSHASSVQRISFIGTVALRASLLGIKQQTNKLGNDIEDLVNTLSQVAEIYDQAENQIRNHAQI